MVLFTNSRQLFIGCHIQLGGNPQLVARDELLTLHPKNDPIRGSIKRSRGGNIVHSF